MGMPVGSIIEITYIGRLLDQLTMSVRHYYVAAQSTTPSVTDEIDNILGHFSDMGVGSVLPAYLQVIPEEMTVERVAAQMVAPDRLRRQTDTIDQTGLGGGTALSNCQASITFTTRLSGRDQQGAIRVPAAPGNALAGRWIAAYITDLTSLAARLSEPFTEPDGDGIYQPCIYHRTKAPPENRTDIVAFIIQETTRVIRRRTLGVGQ
jgi:hypothetical protein